MSRLIGYARVSALLQSTDRQVANVLVGVRRDVLCVDHRLSGARSSRLEFNREFEALHGGDLFVIATAVRLRHSSQSMLNFAEQLRGHGADMRVFNLRGGDVDTSTPMSSMVFIVVAALAQMELVIKRERIADLVATHRAADGDLGGRPVR